MSKHILQAIVGNHIVSTRTFGLFLVPVDGTITLTRYDSDMAAVNGARFDLLLNGVSIYPTVPDQPAIADGGTSVSQAESTPVVAGDRVELRCYLTGSFGSIGAKLYANIYVEDGLSGTGVVETIVEGTGINVDATDPANPIVDVDTTVMATRAYADGLVTSVLNDRGNYDASSNAFPSSGGSGTAGAIKKGNLWTISVASAGNIGSGGTQPVQIGDIVRALVDTPGNTPANWAITEHNFSYVPENQANKDTDGTMASNSDTLYPSQKAAKTYSDTKVPQTRTINGHALSANVTLNQSDIGQTGLPVEVGVAVSDETTAITTGTAVLTFYIQQAFTLAAVWAGLSAQSTSGLPTIDIKKNGTSIFTTKITIDANEDTSLTAATPAVLNGTVTFARGDKVTVNIDVAGTGAKGLKVFFEGTR